MLVVDASVAVKWYLAEPDSHLAHALGGRSDLIAPDLVIAEFANILWKAEQLGRITPVDADLAARGVAGWFRSLLPSRPLVTQALTIARTLRHPAYDCFYLALAERVSASLISADRRLVAKLTGTPWASLVQPLSSLPAAGP